ncbi:MAG: hypothetical protein RLZZ44_1415 [Bacteroidota bacterium]
MEKPSKETLEKWQKDPNNWKWGCIYYNKEDQRLLPPKRIPAMGWTVNFANPKSVMLFIALLFISLVMVVYSLWPS